MSNMIFFVCCELPVETCSFFWQEEINKMKRKAAINRMFDMLFDCDLDENQGKGRKEKEHDPLFEEQVIINRLSKI